MFLKRAINSIASWTRVFHHIGAVGAFRLFVLNIIKKTKVSTAGFKLRATGCPYPLLARAASSDYEVFCQVWVEQQYKPVIDLVKGGLVLDLGANVGYSSAYFLAVGKAATVVAVEPDFGNYNLLEENLRHFGGAAHLVRGAVWSHPTRLSITDQPYRDGREWARQVTEIRNEGSASFDAFTITQILDSVPGLRVSLLKMDIEGAETQIFKCSDCSWLNIVDAVAIEFHPDSSFGNAEPYFHKLFLDHDFTKFKSGELLICQRRK